MKKLQVLAIKKLTPLLKIVSALVITSSYVLATTAFTHSDNPSHKLPDYCAWLEQENVNRKAPFLTGSRGIFYVAGKDLPGGPDATMPVQENETLGFTHAFFLEMDAREGRQ